MPNDVQVTYPSQIVCHQIKQLSMFSGKGGMKIEDWVRDVRHVICSKGIRSQLDQFNEVVRHTSGRARDVLLNLELYCEDELTAERAFQELADEYGEDDVTTSPMSSFYARLQHSNESPSEYAVALEAKLRVAREKGEQAARVDQRQRDKMLTTQFMHGLRNSEVKARLAPMRPREMSYRELRKELRVIDSEERAKVAQSFRQTTNPTEAQFKTTSSHQSKDVECLTKAINELTVTQQRNLEMVHEAMKDFQDRLCLLEKRGGRADGRADGRGRARQPPQCYTCGQVGHFSRACPNVPSN